MNREQQIEQAGKIYCKDCVALKFPSCMGNLKRTDILAAYRNGAEWADKSMIDKACEWIKYHNENGGCLFDNWEESFRKTMFDNWEESFRKTMGVKE